MKISDEAKALIKKEQDDLASLVGRKIVGAGHGQGHYGGSYVLRLDDGRSIAFFGEGGDETTTVDYEIGKEA